MDACMEVIGRVGERRGYIFKDVHKVNGGHFLNSTIAESKYETYCLAKTICQFRHVGFPTHFNTRWNT